MKMKDMTWAGIILLMLAFIMSPVHAATDNATNETNSSDVVAAGGEEEQLVDDIAADESIIGPDNVFYSFTIALDDLDVTFTFNETEKLEKQISKAQKRLAQIKAALKKNNLKAADIAIEQYRNENEKANESISKLRTNDGKLVRVQAMIAKHQYVLEGLIDTHPNNTGLIRAHNNSERLINKFASKTRIKLERETDKSGHKKLKHVKVEDDGSDEYEKTSIKASVEDNKTHVKVELKFLTNSTEPADIAGDILDRIDAIGINVSDIIKIEHDDDAGDSKDDNDEAEPEVTVTGGPTTTLTTTSGIRTVVPSKEKLKAQAEVNGNTTRVQFEYQFFLNETEGSAIITGVEDKLSAITADRILGALDVNVKEKKAVKKETKREERKKAEINEDERENKSGMYEKDRSKGSDD